MGTLMQNLLKKQALKKRLDVLEKEIHLDQAKEVDLLTQEGLSYNAALRKVKDIYEKAHNHTDQDSDYELEKTFKDIISDEEDIDNGEAYNKETGETTRNLVDGMNEFYKCLDILNRIVKEIRVYDRENTDFYIKKFEYSSLEDIVYVDFEGENVNE